MFFENYKEDQGIFNKKDSPGTIYKENNYFCKRIVIPKEFLNEYTDETHTTGIELTVYKGKDSGESVKVKDGTTIEKVSYYESDKKINETDIDNQINKLKFVYDPTELNNKIDNKKDMTEYSKYFHRENTNIVPEGMIHHFHEIELASNQDNFLLGHDNHKSGSIVIRYNKDNIWYENGLMLHYTIENNAHADGDFILGPDGTGDTITRHLYFESGVQKYLAQQDKIGVTEFVTHEDFLWKSLGNHTYNFGGEILLKVPSEALDLFVRPNGYIINKTRANTCSFNYTPRNLYFPANKHRLHRGSTGADVESWAGNIRIKMFWPFYSNPNPRIHGTTNNASGLGSNTIGYNSWNGNLYALTKFTAVGVMRHEVYWR